MSLLSPAHQLAAKLPKYEAHDLAQQMRRASKSIPANIAEGYSKRRTAKDFKLYLAHAMGSANEMVVHVRMAEQLGYCSEKESEELTEGYNVVGKQLNRLIQRWR